MLSLCFMRSCKGNTVAVKFINASDRGAKNIYKQGTVLYLLYEIVYVTWLKLLDLCFRMNS